MSIINELEKHLNESRNLSVSQKKALTSWYNKTKSVDLSNDMSSKEFDKIESMNPHETFESNAVRFIMDLATEERKKNKYT
jgi:hypothetical protein